MTDVRHYSTVSILVTGSRSAANPTKLKLELSALLGFDRVLLFIGDCNIGTDKPCLGADRFAFDWWHEHFGEGAVRTSPERLCERWTQNQHELVVMYADWYPNNDGVLDKSAGPKRNSRTVRAFGASPGHKRAFAVWAADTGGTFDTMKKLVKAERIGFQVIPA